MRLKALFEGLVSFKGSFVFLDQDGSKRDPFGSIPNGSIQQLSPSGLAEAVVALASKSFTVKTNDGFGFCARSLDSRKGASFTQIANASCTPSSCTPSSISTADVPGPLSLLGLGAAIGFSRRLKTRLQLNSPRA